MIKTKSTKAGERTQHTPGPWWNVGTGILAGDKNDPEVIASTESNDVMNVQNSEEAEANARLIAAAPELLAFVKDYFHQADCGDGGEHDEDMSNGRCWHCTARKLVAKAEGK